MAFQNRTFLAKDSVGALHSVEEIKANPSASVDDIEWLAEQDSAAAIAHPNCPAALWWELAVEDPIGAIQSVLYPLMTLESPERWAQLERDNGQWLTRELLKTPFQVSEQFAIDCAARALPIFEKAYPSDLRPREAITMRRRYAQGLATAPQLLDAVNHARQAAHEAQTAQPTAAANAAAELTANIACRHAANAIAYNQMNTPLAYDRERLWQWRHLVSLLRHPAKVGAAYDGETKSTPDLLTYEEHFKRQPLDYQRAWREGSAPPSGPRQVLEDLLPEDRRQNALSALKAEAQALARDGMWVTEEPQPEGLFVTQEWTTFFIQRWLRFFGEFLEAWAPRESTLVADVLSQTLLLLGRIPGLQESQLETLTGLFLLDKAVQKVHANGSLGPWPPVYAAISVLLRQIRLILRGPRAEDEQRQVEGTYANATGQFVDCEWGLYEADRRTDSAVEIDNPSRFDADGLRAEIVQQLASQLDPSREEEGDESIEDVADRLAIRVEAFCQRVREASVAAEERATEAIEEVRNPLATPAAAVRSAREAAAQERSVAGDATTWGVFEEMVEVWAAEMDERIEEGGEIIEAMGNLVMLWGRLGAGR